MAPGYYTIQTPAQLRELLIAYRKQAKLTQAGLAEKLGISQQSYAQIEANPMVTSVDRLYRILRILGVELQLAKPAAALRTSDTVAYPGNVEASDDVMYVNEAQSSYKETEDKEKGAGSSPALTKLIPPRSDEKDRW
jgi:HTH-type transcriptional regulator/antitoxin HipB